MTEPWLAMRWLKRTWEVCGDGRVPDGKTAA